MPEENGLIPAVVDDFTGGKTDYYLGGAPNKFEQGDNLFLDDRRTPDTRPGCRAKYPARFDTALTPRSIVGHDEKILVQSGTKVQYYNAGVQTITTPNALNVFATGDDDTKASFAYWNGHTIAVSDDFAQPKKIFINELGSWKAENLGLPDPTYANSISFANHLKEQFNLHIGSGKHATADTNNVIASANAVDLQTLITLTNELITKYQAHAADAQLSSGWVYHSDEAVADYRLESANAVTTVFGCFQALEELRKQYNLHEADTTTHSAGVSRQADLLLSPQATSAGSGGNTYLYALHFTYRYKVEDKEFLERSRVHLFQITGCVAPDTTTIGLYAIPYLQSLGVEAWNDSNIKVTLFRSTNGGEVLFRLAEIPNGQTTYFDSLPDSDLTNNETAYTEGGILDDDLPPAAKYVAVVGDVLVLGHYKEGSLLYDNRVIMSKPAQLGGMPTDFFESFEATVTGLGQVNTYPIVFLKSKCYRLEGRYDSLGKGSIRKRSISQRIGCISHKSIVPTEDGVFFAAENGFYFTDGFNVQLVSTELEISYNALVNKSNIVGTHDRQNNWVLWTTQKDVLSPEHDSLWVTHLKFRTPEGGYPFTTWSGGHDPDNFSATAMAYIDGSLYRADRRGYILEHRAEYTSDAYVDILASPANWFTQTITFEYRSVASDFGDAQSRKWVTKFNCNIDNLTTLHLDIASNNDNSKIWNELRPISDSSRVFWGDRSLGWDETGTRWNYAAVISQWRFFPATGNLRCMYKQVRFKNSYFTIDTSESTGTATVVSVDKTATFVFKDVISHTLLQLGLTTQLEQAPDNKWLTDPVNYFISFSNDGFELEYKIIGRTDLVLTLSDPDANLPDAAGLSWRIRGYKKDERFRLLNYTVNFGNITMTQQTFRAGN